VQPLLPRENNEAASQGGGVEGVGGGHGATSELRMRPLEGQLSDEAQVTCPECSLNSRSCLSGHIQKCTG
jgi:hypothetical protein